MVGKKRSKFFNDIKLKAISKISSWQHKFYLCRGKEILIKVVVQVVSTYTMSVFKIPTDICDDIQRVIANF